MVLRCTAKLLNFLDHRASPIIEAEPHADDWYSHVFTIERRKCLLLVHADTLFSVLVTDVRVAQVNDLGTYAATLVIDALVSEGLAGTTLGPTDPAGLRVAKTASRHVLGHMNEMAFEVKDAVARTSGLDSLDIEQLNRQLRRGLRGRGRDYVVPLELAAARPT